MIKKVLILCFLSAFFAPLAFAADASVSSQAASNLDDQQFADEVLKASQSGDFTLYKKLWYPKCAVGGKQWPTPEIQAIDHTTPVVQLEEKSLTLRKDLLSRVTVNAAHISKIDDLEKNGLSKGRAEEVSQSLEPFSPKPNFYIWADVTSTEHGHRMTELGYALMENNSYYLLDGSCIKTLIPSQK